MSQKLGVFTLGSEWSAIGPKTITKLAMTPGRRSTRSFEPSHLGQNGRSSDLVPSPTFALNQEHRTFVLHLAFGTFPGSASAHVPMLREAQTAAVDVG